MTDASTGPAGRKPIIDALMTLLAETPVEQVGVGDVARQAGLSLAELRAEFGSVMAILAAHVKEIDRQVLAADTSDMAGEPARERLFDILMRRLDALTPNKAAVRSLMRSSLRNPGLALAMNGLTARSMSWMMTAAGIPVAGPKGMVRAQALALLYARVLATWTDDEDPGLARTMSVLDRELARGQRWSGFLDNLCAVPERLCRSRRTARRRRDPDDEIVAA